MSGPEYRRNDYDSEGGLRVMTGDIHEVELTSLREWMNRISDKVESIHANGCSHRTDDIGRLSRVQSALEELERTVNTFRVEVTNQMAAIKLWVAIGAMSVCAGAAGWIINLFVRHTLTH